LFELEKGTRLSTTSKIKDLSDINYFHLDPKCSFTCVDKINACKYSEPRKKNLNKT